MIDKLNLASLRDTVRIIMRIADYVFLLPHTHYINTRIVCEIGFYDLSHFPMNLKPFAALRRSSIGSACPNFTRNLEILRYNK